MTQTRGSKYYAVSWTIKFTRYIEADSKEEAEEISQDMGDADSDMVAPYQMKAKRVSRATYNHGICIPDDESPCGMCGRMTPYIGKLTPRDFCYTCSIRLDIPYQFHMR